MRKIPLTCTDDLVQITLIQNYQKKRKRKKRKSRDSNVKS